jgi:Domain of unknown function (DUF4386)
VARGLRSELVGNRLALVGAIVYLLEWVVIVFLADVPTDDFGGSSEAIVDAYTGESGTTAFAAGWFSVVLLGRVLFVAAVRRAFHDSGRRSILLDLALGAMIVSVAIEVVSLALPAAAAWIADNGPNTGAIVALDAAASMTFAMIFAPIGVAVLSTAVVMVGSRLFPAWVGWLGVVAGALAVVGGVSGAATLGDDDLRELGQQPSAIGALLFWVWMLATAVILWRRRPR